MGLFCYYKNNCMENMLSEFSALFLISVLRVLAAIWEAWQNEQIKDAMLLQHSTNDKIQRKL